jgi:Mrp family chromosome partitioning ATPase
MSVLDEAFIKAYRKRMQAPSGRPGAPVPAPAWIAPRPQTLHARQGDAVPQPHAAFAASAARRSSEAPAIEAAFEVPHFIWPTVVTELLARAPAEFARASAWLAALVDRSPKVVLMAGMLRGEGRTTVLLALAQAAAQRNLRCSLVDLDFFKPELADRLGIMAQVGGEEVFGGEMPLGDALVESLAEPLSVLPLVRPLADPDRVAAKRRVSATLQLLRRSHDLVLVDAPPLDSDAQAIDLAALLAGSVVQDAVVVRDPQRVAADELRLISRRLAAAGVSRWHIIENFVQAA